MVLRIPGPFPYFQDKYAGANGDTIRLHISDPSKHAEAISSLADDLDGDDKAVAAAIEGDIEAGARTNPQTASRTAVALAAKGRYAVGLLTRFANDVDAFDRAVNGLNVKADAASAADHVLGPLYDGPAVLAGLRREYVQVEGVLDAAGDDIARMFTSGATADNVRDLIRSGCMPLAAAALYPGLHLTADDRAAYYRAKQAEVRLGQAEDAALKNPALAALARLSVSFEYVKDGDFYTTTEHGIQSQLGYHDDYEALGPLIGADLDAQKFEFTDDKTGKEYRLELWKGSYGFGSGFGGEVGFYTRDPAETGLRGALEGRDPGYYSTAEGDDQIKMTQTISNKLTGEHYFTNDGAGADGTDQRHFWNLAIRSDPGVSKQDLMQSGEITVQNEDVRAAMLAKMQQTAADPGSHLSNVSEVDGVIRYTWDV